MTPVTKASVTAGAVLASIVIVPAVLIVFKDYVLITLIFVVYSAVLVLFFTEMYWQIRSHLLRRLEEDEEVTQAFAHSPLAMHYYRGFRKYFDGDLDKDQLETWLKRHRPDV